MALNKKSVLSYSFSTSNTSKTHEETSKTQYNEKIQLC